jgi:hypothetical protein
MKSVGRENLKIQFGILQPFLVGSNKSLTFEKNSPIPTLRAQQTNLPPMATMRRLTSINKRAASMSGIERGRSSAPVRFPRLY